MSDTKAAELLGGRGMLVQSIKSRLTLVYFANPFEPQTQRLIEYKGTKYVVDWDYLHQAIKILGIFDPTKKPTIGKYGFDAIENPETIGYEIEKELIEITTDFSDAQIGFGLQVCRKNACGFSHRMNFDR